MFCSNVILSHLFLVNKSSLGSGSIEQLVSSSFILSLDLSCFNRTCYLITKIHGWKHGHESIALSNWFVAKPKFILYHFINEINSVWFSNFVDVISKLRSYSISSPLGLQSWLLYSNLSSSIRSDILHLSDVSSIFVIHDLNLAWNWLSLAPSCKLDFLNNGIS